MPSRGAFMDPNGVRWDTNNADFEGVMSKKSRWMGEWRKRYLILKGPKLFFSKDSTSAPHGIIDLVDCISIKSAEKKAKKKYAIEIELKTETSMMVANSEKDVYTWISKISQAIVDYSSIFVPPPPAPVASSNGSVSSRSNSRNSSNVSLSEMADGSVAGAEDDGEEGLLTFDDIVPLAGAA
uniref:PH domain-containing protein n=1 Tax=Spumella elongata TaxID=89044 RepID=A0A7S3HH90_9STRA|mmetsp:Transcript_5300/g.8962  ORF Transcript_5300/g.8962 Transcript_5300/m.8962 type:complete len:182 (+) Transcript_5300:24-569(+)|eukprot:CAMPEP_0184970300 /NCGR_PEP_ID=MMETSP1098-20130426/2834_1 /TAXON_ID=89044 /ORGANISM="Spumella elongata, Strain CCAP 955/1" /LENGTH=181 /DNA_ID=CAMNT_0027492225 /DNA_START=23 /DNA_END=568 /DNA_ORIENTATION=+